MPVAGVEGGEVDLQREEDGKESIYSICLLGWFQG